MQYIAAHFPNNVHVEGPESFLAYQYADDGAFIDPGIGVRPRQAISLWEDALTRGLGPAAAHLQKRRIAGNAETALVLWGITLSTTDNTFTLPRGKLTAPKNS